MESTQQEEPIPSIVEEELTAVESILCREGEFIRLSETCIRLELETGTWLTLGNALDVFLGFKTLYLIFVSFITSIPVVIKTNVVNVSFFRERFVLYFFAQEYFVCFVNEWRPMTSKLQSIMRIQIRIRVKSVSGSATKS